MNQLDDILRKVQGLLRKADHPNTSPTEGQAFRAKAEQLMFKYRVDEAMLATGMVSTGIDPVFRKFSVCEWRNNFRTYYQYMMGYVTDHLDIRATFGIADGNMEVEVCGFPGDVQFAEMLMTTCALAFSAKLEPVYDAELSEQVNAYVMRMAGMEGKRIAMAIFGKCDKGDPPKVRKMFKREAELRGEDPSVLLGQGNDMKTYRDSYAEGFVSQLGARLREMRMLRGADGTLVIGNRKARIDEAFWTKNPHLRPRPVAGAIGQTNVSACKNCAKAKSGYCREHAYLRPRKYKDRPFNGRGYNAGRAAAATVNLEGS